MIPKSQHNDPFASQEVRAPLIANLPRTIVMPATVQFDRELCGRAVEIQNVAVQRMLTAKFIAYKVSVPQMAPKYDLRIGCFLSQQTSVIHEELSYSPAQFLERLISHPSPSTFVEDYGATSSPLPANKTHSPIRVIRTAIDESFHSLRKFSPVVFRPAVDETFGVHTRPHIAFKRENR